MALDSTTIICGLISAASAILVCIINNIYTKNLIVYRLEQLEKKMDEHRKLIDRIYQLEKDVAVLYEHISDGDDRK